MIPSMDVVLAMTRHEGVRLAEIGFLLIVIAGIWLAAAELPLLRFARFRRIIAGLAFAAAGVLLIVATHWGHF
jgi:hypothetical protein